MSELAFQNRELAFQRDEEEIFNKAADFICPRKTDVALDVGTGSGSGAFALAGSVKKVYGIEIRPERIAEAKEKALKNKVDNVEFSVGVAQKLEFADESFDIVMCRVAFHHLAEPMKVLSEINRVLKPGGKFEMSDPVFSEFAKAVWVPVNRLREYDFYSFYTYFDFVSMLNKSGFEVVSIQPFHFRRGFKKWMADGSESVRKRIREVVLGLDKRVLEELRFTPDSVEEWIWYYNCVEILSVKRAKPI